MQSRWHPTSALKTAVSREVSLLSPVQWHESPAPFGPCQLPGPPGPRVPRVEAETPQYRKEPWRARLGMADSQLSELLLEGGSVLLHVPPPRSYRGGRRDGDREVTHCKSHTMAWKHLDQTLLTNANCQSMCQLRTEVGVPVFWALCLCFQHQVRKEASWP